jgi:hypothetical protein
VSDLRRPLSEDEREAERGLRKGFSEQALERAAEARAEQEARIARAAETQRDQLRRAEERERAKLFLRTHWVIESDVDRWLEDRDLVLYLAVARCPSILPEDVLVLEDGSTHKVRLHPDDIATLEEFRESRYAVSAQEIVDTGGPYGLPIQVWYSRSDDSESAYPYFQWGAHWYAVADLKPGVTLKRQRFGAPDMRRRLPGAVWGILRETGPSDEEIERALKLQSESMATESIRALSNRPKG